MVNKNLSKAGFSPADQVRGWIYTTALVCCEGIPLFHGVARQTARAAHLSSVVSVLKSPHTATRGTFPSSKVPHARSAGISHGIPACDRRAAAATGCIRASSEDANFVRCTSISCLTSSARRITSHNRQDPMNNGNLSVHAMFQYAVQFKHFTTIRQTIDVYGESERV